MGKGIPLWALETATPQHRQRAQAAYRNGTWEITWPERKSIRAWAKQQGWPVSWFNFEAGFIEKLLESDDAFARGLHESGLEVRIPLQQYSVSDEQLRGFDALYEEREDRGVLGLRSTSWGSLVGEMREIRRAIEADVVVQIEGLDFKRGGSFLSWVHERYHLLEDGYDSWVGDDAS